MTLIASHADVDHIQGFAKAKQILKTTVTAHPLAAEPLESGDKLVTYAEIAAQNIHLDMPPVKVEKLVEDGDRIRVGSLELEVWHTPGHTDGQLSFRLGNLLFSGDNLFRDGCVGAIDAHHGSSIPDFIKSLQRIRASDVEWLLPSHGPVFRKDERLIDQHDRPAGNLSSHGRLRHLRDRLAAHGPVGARAGRRQNAGVARVETYRQSVECGIAPHAPDCHGLPPLSIRLQPAKLHTLSPVRRPVVPVVPDFPSIRFITRVDATTDAGTIRSTAAGIPALLTHFDSGGCDDPPDLFRAGRGRAAGRLVDRRPRPKPSKPTAARGATRTTRWIGTASITIRTCTTRRTSGATSTTAAPTVCTSAIRPKCGSRSTTATGTTIIRLHDPITADTTSSSTFSSRRPGG